ncbi:fibronectin type III domain-containing protein [Adlercreutzia caecimuris]|mgnify:CR=1 FL=1|uniref:fibronectin type III domain-containing protein n=1 Tax=Adlercreutzia caecimuris TaxID=671266 RepID=UPI0025906DEB|nr:fibronectin type III domain-containing protein [Adlercreutzia caecimuris]
MTTQHLNKVIAGTLAAMLTCALVPAQALSPIDLSAPKAYADEVSQTRTDIVKATYLTRNADGTYRLNESALTTQEEWKDLGAAGFFLWAGYDQAADILLNPYDHIKVNNQDADVDRYVQMDNLGDSDDATAYDNMQSGIDLVNDWNLTRQYENENGTADEKFKDVNRQFYQFKLDGKKLDMLKISPELVAREMRAVNFSSIVAFEHTEIDGTLNEMLACQSKNYANGDIHTNRNPFYNWYFRELEAFLNGESLSIGNGHWPCVVTIHETIVGAAKAEDRTSATGSLTSVYGCNAANAKQVTSFNLTVMEIDDYQAKLNAYKAFVSSLPSDASSGIDPDTSASGTTKPTPENAPKPTYAYGTDYTYAADPNGGAAGVTYPTLTYAGAPVTLDVVITDAKGNRLVEGTDYTMSYAHNNEITAMTGFRATWTATDVNKKWSLTGEFIIAEAKADTSAYKWSGKLSAYTTDLTGASVKIANKAQTFLYTADGAKASVGWHTVDGRRYYCAKEGKPVYVDCTIDGTAYTATWDAASQTYYLVKAQASTTPSKPSQPEPSKPETPVTPSKPSKPETPVVPAVPSKPTTPSKPSQPETPKPETPVTPSKPSKPETPVVPVAPSKPTTPSNPNATKPVTPSAPDTSEADTRAEEEAKKAAEEARKKAEAEAAAKRKAEAAKKKAQEEAAKKAALAKKNGWRTEGGYRLYYVKGTPLTGWQTLSGKKYYFNKSGKMAKGWLKLSGKTYYFNGNGAMLKGFAAPAVKAKSAKSAKKRSLTVKWAKPKVKKAKVCAYQVRCSLKKSMAGAKKSKTVKGKSVTLTKLKSGKRYYVQVRYQAKVNGKKCWTSWGKAVRSGKVR